MSITAYTESDPWKIDLDALFGINLSTGTGPGFDINFVAYYELDANGRFDVHLDWKCSFTKRRQVGQTCASLTAWLATISFGGGGGFAFAFDPNIEFLLNLYGDCTDPSKNSYDRIAEPNQQVTINGDNYDFYAGSVHAGAGSHLVKD